MQFWADSERKLPSFRNLKQRRSFILKIRFTAFGFFILALSKIVESFLKSNIYQINNFGLYSHRVFSWAYTSHCFSCALRSNVWKGKRSHFGAYQPLYSIFIHECRSHPYSRSNFRKVVEHHRNFRVELSGYIYHNNWHRLGLSIQIIQWWLGTCHRTGIVFCSFTLNRLFFQYYFFPQHMSKEFWTYRRIQYAKICDLINTVDNTITHLILLSFSNNLVFICKQLFLSMR